MCLSVDLLLFDFFSRVIFKCVRSSINVGKFLGGMLYCFHVEMVNCVLDHVCKLGFYLCFVLAMLFSLYKCC